MADTSQRQSFLGHIERGTRKEYLGWSSAHLAELADVSKVSIDRIMTVNTKDLRISTMQAVTRALVNGIWGKHPCVFAASENMQIDATECAKLREEMAQLKAAHKAELEAIRAENDQKIAFLKDQVIAKDKLLEAITHLIDREKK